MNVLKTVDLVHNNEVSTVSQNYVPTLEPLFSAISVPIRVQLLAFYTERAQVLSDLLLSQWFLL